MKKIIICLLLVNLAFLGGCKERETQDEIVRVTVAGQLLCIPKSYSYMGGLSGKSDQSIFIAAFHPEFNPLRKVPKEVFKENEQDKIVRILVTDKNRYSNMNSFVKDVNSRLLRFPDQDEFGLEYYRYEIKDRGDYYAEIVDGKGVSTIRCSAKYDEQTTPQCNQQSQNGPFHYKVSFDKRLLPHWREIKQKSYDLIDSFNCIKNLDREKK